MWPGRTRRRNATRTRNKVLSFQRLVAGNPYSSADRSQPKSRWEKPTHQLDGEPNLRHGIDLGHWTEAIRGRQLRNKPFPLSKAVEV